VVFARRAGCVADALHVAAAAAALLTHHPHTTIPTNSVPVELVLRLCCKRLARRRRRRPPHTPPTITNPKKTNAQGDELIATSGVTYSKESEYGEVKVKMGQQVGLALRLFTITITSVALLGGTLRKPTGGKLAGWSGCLHISGTLVTEGAPCKSPRAEEASEVAAQAAASPTPCHTRLSTICGPPSPPPPSPVTTRSCA
jgi:hypothetical protein